MSGEYILAIDQGTTATTVLVVDRSGTVVGRGTAAVRQGYPRPGWVEHDPDQLWETVLAATGEALAAAHIAPGEAAARLAAVGITNQRETTILWERATGRPVAPAWQRVSRAAPTMLDTASGEKKANEAVEFPNAIPIDRSELQERLQCPLNCLSSSCRLASLP